MNDYGGLQNIDERLRLQDFHPEGTGVFNKIYIPFLGPTGQSLENRGRIQVHHQSKNRLLAYFLRQVC